MPTVLPRFGARAPAADDAEAASFAALTAKLGYLAKADTKRIREAYKFADEAHLGQFRASGEPYITHPIAVAGLCADWKLDAQAIKAALMHDAMEDCGVTKTELIERFGAQTADLVDGLTKLDKLQFSTREESPGRVLPQDAAGDVARRARHPRSSSPTGCTTCARCRR